LNTYGAFTTGAAELVVSVQSVNASNQLIPGTFDTVVFYMNGTSMYREVFPDAASSRLEGTKLLGTDISSLAFTYDNVNLAAVTLVTTDITVVKQTREARDITVSSKSRLRN
jgi:hypothetical protein